MLMKLLFQPFTAQHEIIIVFLVLVIVAFLLKTGVQG